MTIEDVWFVSASISENFDPPTRVPRSATSLIFQRDVSYPSKGPLLNFILPHNTSIKATGLNCKSALKHLCYYSNIEHRLDPLLHNLNPSHVCLSATYYLEKFNLSSFLKRPSLQMFVGGKFTH